MPDPTPATPMQCLQAIFQIADSVDLNGPSHRNLSGAYITLKNFIEENEETEEPKEE